MKKIRKVPILNSILGVHYTLQNIYSNLFFSYNATNMLKKFQNFCRMSSIDFEYLLYKIVPYAVKMDINMGESIPIQERLAVTLW